jgi:hypothetical protein
MGDSFNPHEILSRLRAKPVGMNNANSTPSNNGGNNTTNGNHGGPLGPNGISSPNKPSTASKTIKQPASLNLTPAQVLACSFILLSYLYSFINSDRTI